MAFYGKSFVAEREENFDEFFKGIGVPEERAQKMRQFKPNQKIEKGGDNYVFTITTLMGEKVIKFKSGEEFDDVFNDLKVKVTMIMEGNKLTQTLKFENGSILNINKQFTDDSFVEEISHSKWPGGTASRYYKAQ